MLTERPLWVDTCVLRNAHVACASVQGCCLGPSTRAHKTEAKPSQPQPLKLIQPPPPSKKWIAPAAVAVEGVHAIVTHCHHEEACRGQCQGR